MTKQEEIYQFWFRGVSDQDKADWQVEPYKFWFLQDENFDKEIQKNFEDDITKAVQGDYKDWELTPQGCLALIILFDQFGRNIYRNTPRMFATDPLAVDLTQRCLKEGKDQKLPLIERIFMYMPLMHSEDMDVQKLSVKVFAKLVEDSKEKYPHNTPFFAGNLKYAREHHNDIEKHGHFPYRRDIKNK